MVHASLSSFGRVNAGLNERIVDMKSRERHLSAKRES
jgi:hypothetical protein